jgi:hypothetical protein
MQRIPRPAARTQRRASTFLLRLLTRIRFAYVRLLEFGDGDNAWNRFFNHVNDRGFDERGNWRLHRPRLFPRKLFRPGALSLSHTATRLRSA